MEKEKSKGKKKYLVIGIILIFLIAFKVTLVIQENKAEKDYMEQGILKDIKEEETTNLHDANTTITDFSNSITDTMELMITISIIVIVIGTIFSILFRFRRGLRV